jgi:uncharacterized membrane protein YgdD (TMEM256/DUF423 family)
VCAHKRAGINSLNREFKKCLRPPRVTGRIPRPMHRWILFSGAVSGALGVLLGAFGAHGLKSRLSQDLLVIFEVGVRYQMFHALALLMVGVLALQRPSGSLQAAAWLWIAGSLVFSGSLYILAVTGARWLGAITPVGGSMLIAGWVALALAAWRLP